MEFSTCPQCGAMLPSARLDDKSWRMHMKWHDLLTDKLISKQDKAKP